MPRTLHCIPLFALRNRCMIVGEHQNNIYSDMKEKYSPPPFPLLRLISHSCHSPCTNIPSNNYRSHFSFHVDYLTCQPFNRPNLPIRPHSLHPPSKPTIPPPPSWMHPSAPPIRHFFVRVRVVSFPPERPGHGHVPTPVHVRECIDLLLPFPTLLFLCVCVASSSLFVVFVLVVIAGLLFRVGGE